MNPSIRLFSFVKYLFMWTKIITSVTLNQKDSVISPKESPVCALVRQIIFALTSKKYFPPHT